MVRALASVLGVLLSALACVYLLLMVLGGAQTIALGNRMLTLAPATAIHSLAAPTIQLTATVGTNPDECATAKTITVTAGSEVVYCYTVSNTSDFTFTDHAVLDIEAGVVTSFSNALLAPQSTFFVTALASVEKSMDNTVTWTATDTQGIPAMAQSGLHIVVPSIAVTHTVGLDPNTCALSDTLTVMPGAYVTHCYQITNTDALTFYTHSAVDERMGAVVAADWPYQLPPGDSVVVMASEVATVSGVSIVTWTATVTDGLYAVGVDSALVRVPAIVATATVGTDPRSCGDTSIISVTVGDPVTYCYRVTNNSGVVFQPVVGEDSVADSKPIVVITPLLDISELVVRVTAPVTQSLVNTVSWVAHTEGGLTATASALARVNTLARVQTLAYYDVDRDGIVDPLEMGVGNVTITLESPLGISQTVRTDAAGAGGFDSLANGQYTLTVSTDDLTRAYSVDSAFRAQPLDIAIGQLYTATFPLILPDETDSDRDSLYDYIEGPDDFDRDGIPNYLDPDNYLFMPLVKRE